MSFKINGIQRGIEPSDDIALYTIHAPEGEFSKAHGMTFATPLMSSIEDIKEAFLKTAARCQ